MYTSIEKLLAALPRPETEGQSVMVYVAERRGTASSDPYDTAVFGNEADAIAWANRQKFERESKHYDEQVAVVDAYRHEAEYGDDELLRWDTNPTDATTVFARDLPDTVSTAYQDFVEQVLSDVALLPGVDQLRDPHYFRFEDGSNLRIHDHPPMVRAGQDSYGRELDHSIILIAGDDPLPDEQHLRGKDLIFRQGEHSAESIVELVRGWAEVARRRQEEQDEQLLGQFEGASADELGDDLGAAGSPADAPLLRRVHEIDYSKIVKPSTSLSDDAQ